MAEQMQPMLDAPDRCPYCNSGDRREETWLGSPAYSFSCGTVFYANGEVAWRYFSCYVREKGREERAILEQLAARAEAERWKQQYEFLRSEMERLVQELRYRAHLFAKDWLETDDDYYEGASDAYYSAEKMVRRMLSEAGGVSQ